MNRAIDRLETWIEQNARAGAALIVSGGKVALMLVALGASLLLASQCAGCGSPIRTAANAATITTELVITAGDEIDAHRDRALDAVEAAHPEHGPERDAALDAEAAEWRPLGIALDAIRATILTWTQAITLAHAASSDALWPEVLRLAARVVGLYESLRQAALGVGIDDLPALPDEVRSLVRALGGG